MTAPTEDRRKVVIEIEIVKPKDLEITEDELQMVLNTTVQFFGFHFDQLIMIKRKNPNPKLN